uniref:Uncharacterized protein n=1 Tax=Physcomitrium patens TaxID=3218 RepID=A0A2K1JZT4_PHYPA|nr:hypothetical protein PHYPA_014156 [Physcomitrium patens]
MQMANNVEEVAVGCRLSTSSNFSGPMRTKTNPRCKQPFMIDDADVWAPWEAPSLQKRWFWNLTRVVSLPHVRAKVCQRQPGIIHHSFRFLVLLTRH